MCSTVTNGNLFARGTIKHVKQNRQQVLAIFGITFISGNLNSTQGTL